jgi:hypothetical protein
MAHGQLKLIYTSNPPVQHLTRNKLTPFTAGQT